MNFAEARAVAQAAIARGALQPGTSETRATANGKPARAHTARDLKVIARWTPEKRAAHSAMMKGLWTPEARQRHAERQSSALEKARAARVAKLRNAA